MQFSFGGEHKQKIEAPLGVDQFVVVQAFPPTPATGTATVQSFVLHFFTFAAWRPGPFAQTDLPRESMTNMFPTWRHDLMACAMQAGLLPPLEVQIRPWLCGRLGFCTLALPGPKQSGYWKTNQWLSGRWLQPTTKWKQTMQHTALPCSNPFLHGLSENKWLNKSMVPVGWQGAPSDPADSTGFTING